ncbi:MAG: hypothetical protein ACREEO_15850, partial [Phenylobacterium sp.]
MRCIGMFAAVLATAAVPLAAQAQDDWRIAVTPYIWVAFPQGDVTAIAQRGGGGGGLDEDVKANFDDVGLSGAFTGSVDVGYGRFGVLADLTYYEITADKDIALGRLPDVEGELEVAGTKGLIVGYWRAYETESSQVDLLGGAHYLGIDTDVSVRAPNRSATFSAEEDLWDPVIGVRGKTRLSEHFGLIGLATYGGFGVSSDHLYELQG